jgi:DNA invertase Pin-like site-specific DNA recombinase
MAGDLQTPAKRAALYARVSTLDKGQNPETQLSAMRDFAALRGFDIVDDYVDRGWSGSKDRRPQLDRLMSDAKKGRFDAVLVWRFDRFGRSTSHLIHSLEEFRKLGVDFLSMSESIDTTTAIGRFFYTVLSAFAEFERNVIVERVRAGMARARKEGKAIGRPRAIVDEQKVYERIQAGESIQRVAKTSGINRGTVRAIVARVKKAQDGGCQKGVFEAQVTD